MSLRAHIVGCGLIGSALAFKLSQYELCHKLFIYDYDVVNKCQFPYTRSFVGISKVDALSSVINSLDCDVRVYARHLKITNKKRFSAGLVIDCRDNKTNIIPSHIRLSLDGPIFVIDCRKEYDPERYIEYVLDQDPIYYDLALTIAMNFICNIYQETFTERFVYMLDDMLNTPQVI